MPHRHTGSGATRLRGADGLGSLRFSERYIISHIKSHHFTYGYLGWIVLDRTGQDKATAE